jgi:hypothetical protein
MEPVKITIFLVPKAQFGGVSAAVHIYQDLENRMLNDVFPSLLDFP